MFGVESSNKVFYLLEGKTYQYKNFKTDKYLKQFIDNKEWKAASNTFDTPKRVYTNLELFVLGDLKD